MPYQSVRVSAYDQSTATDGSYRRLAYDETEITIRVVREELRLFGKLQADVTPSNATRRPPQRQTKAAGYVKKITITPTMSVKDLKLKVCSPLRHVTQ
jgi:hypothetical protein